MKLLASFAVLQAACQLLVSSVTGQGVTVPLGFVEQKVGMGEDVVDFHFTPARPGIMTNPMFVTQKRGEIYVFPDPENSQTRKLVVNLTDRVCSNDARGLKTILPHQDYWNTNWVYLFYTWKPTATFNCTHDQPMNRLVRFKVDPITFVGDINNEQILYQGSKLSLSALHEGGCMFWGDDGNLWNTHGEGGYKEATAQNKSNLMGSVIRITPENGIPADNPYVGANTQRCPWGEAPDGIACQENYCKGCRNPFKCFMNPNNKKKYFTDVGSNYWEEVNEIVKGKNYGWPINEGPCSYALGKSKPNCTLAAVMNLPDAQEPLHYFFHDSVLGGAVVGTLVVPNGAWSTRYDDQMLMIEYTTETMYALKLDASQAFRNTTFGRSSYKMEVFLQYPKIIEARFGPYNGTNNAMYFLSRKTPEEAIRRLLYVGGNYTAPEARFQVDNVGYLSPNADVIFNAGGSFDHDFSPLSYTWSFGDGSPLATTTSPFITHKYAALGPYYVVLTVSAHGLTSEVGQYVQIGVTPTVTINSPVPGFYNVGDSFFLSASAQDGNGASIPDGQLSWTILRHHNNHTHDFELRTGNNIVSDQAPPPEDLQATLFGWLEFVVTAKDANNLFTTTSVNSYPRKANITFASVPTGMLLTIYEQPVTTPETDLLWLGHQFTLIANNVTGYTFVGWSDFGAQSHDITIDGTVTTYTAYYHKDTPSPAPHTLIDCGSKTNTVDHLGYIWLADRYYGNGTMTGTVTTANTPSGDDVAIAQTYRKDGNTTDNVSMTYNIPVNSTGSFVVKFIFMEPNTQATGGRVLNVLCEGVKLISNLDIVKEAGGRFVQYTVETPVFNVTDGAVTIVFEQIKGFTVVSGIGLYQMVPPLPITYPTRRPTAAPTITKRPTKSPTLKPTKRPTSRPTFAPTSYPATWTPFMYIDCGSASNYVDKLGRIWYNDTGLFVAGPLVLAGNTTMVYNTTETGLIKTYRTTSSTLKTLQYDIPLPVGNYQFQFWFMDPTKTMPLQRIFNVAIGSSMLSNIDIIQLTGGRRFTLMVETGSAIPILSGSATIMFKATTNYPIVSAMAIYKVP